MLKYNANAHSTLYSCVKSIVEERLAADSSLRITLTGHSLGGAQASLIAAHLLADGVITQPKLELYTFGQPRVGDKDFAYEFDRVSIHRSWVSSPPIISTTLMLFIDCMRSESKYSV